MRGLVITPTFNEFENIEKHIVSVLAQNSDICILIVDDESPDGTAWLVSNLAEENPRIFLLNHGKKMGLGKAYIDGFNWALKNKFDFIIEMDADASHPYEALSRMISMSPEFDCIIGSRYVENGRLVNWSISRKIISKLGNFVARRVCSLSPLDVTGGFRLIKTSLIQKIDLASIESRGYAFQVDLLRKIFVFDILWREIPITFVDREHGKSKMSLGIILEASFLVIKWGFGNFIVTKRR